MNEARRVQLLRCADEAIELVDIERYDRDDDPAWWQKVNAIAARDDGSIQAVMRMLTRLASAEITALESATGADRDTLLNRARLALVGDIENEWLWD